MNTKLTLKKSYRGFESDTEFERVAEYGSWHPAAAKLEALDSAARIEVTQHELETYFDAQALSRFFFEVADTRPQATVLEKCAGWECRERSEWHVDEA